QTLDIEISKNGLVKNNLVFLNASSSIQSNAELGNLDAKFSNSLIDLTKMHTVQLLLQNNSVLPGNYTLGISASDGMVTKTIFLDLQILR
ncbi:MAG TPA: hypothetical protein VNX68_15455, partial [Nitrosopumilaceae archaeon]|nr:hypothetical protein [Nitrosopumilaceae archaeon]